jgi:hypothetical protein
MIGGVHGGSHRSRVSARFVLGAVPTTKPSPFFGSHATECVRERNWNAGNGLGAALLPERSSGAAAPQPSGRTYALRTERIQVRGIEDVEAPLDSLIYVQLGPEYGVQLTRQYFMDQIHPILHYVRHSNTYRMRMAGGLLASGEDITDRIREAFEML